MTRAIDKAPVCNGNTESLRELVSRDSIIGWHFKSFRRKHDRLHSWAADPAMPTVLLFRHPRDLDAWIAALA